MTTTVEKPKAKVEPKGAEAAYHVGLMPAQGMVTMPIPSMTGGGINVEKVDVYDLWNGTAKIGGKSVLSDYAMFIPENRKYMALDVRGFHFPATSQSVEVRGEELNRTTYAGNVVLLTKKRLGEIVRSCKRHFLRFPNGIESIDDPSNFKNATLHDMDHGAKPANFTDSDWAAHKRVHVVDECPDFNPATDKLVADFVYITKLDAVDVSKIDRKDYKRNPNKYHARWAPPLDQSFFTSPPKSVSETYPGDEIEA